MLPPKLRPSSCAQWATGCAGGYLLLISPASRCCAAWVSCARCTPARTARPQRGRKPPLSPPPLPPPPAAAAATAAAAAAPSRAAGGTGSHPGAVGGRSSSVPGARPRRASSTVAISRQQLSTSVYRVSACVCTQSQTVDSEYVRFRPFSEGSRQLSQLLPSRPPAQRACRVPTICRRSVAPIGEPSLLRPRARLLLPLRLHLAAAISAHLLLPGRQLLHLTGATTRHAGFLFMAARPLWTANGWWGASFPGTRNHRVL